MALSNNSQKALYTYLLSFTWISKSVFFAIPTATSDLHQVTKDNDIACDHERHIRAASCRNRLESQLETTNFDPREDETIGGKQAENW